MSHSRWRWLPNAITLGRCLLALLIGVLLLQLPSAASAETTNPLAVWAFVLFVFTAVTDFLDGYLARRLDAISAFGAFLDPIADKVLVAACLMPLVILNDGALVLLVPTGLIISRDLLITGLRLQPSISLPVVTLAKYKTALELIAIGLLLWLLMRAPDHLTDAIAATESGAQALFEPPILGVTLLGLLTLWAAAALAVWSGARYLMSLGGVEKSR